MGNQTKLEIVNDYVYWRKGTAMSPMDLIHKFVWVGSQIAAIGLPTSPKTQGSEELQDTINSRKVLLMSLIFDGTGILVTPKGNLSKRKEGGLQEGQAVKINRTLKMSNSTFNLEKVIEEKDYSSQLHRHQLSAWNITVPKLSHLDNGDFERAIKSSGNADKIGGNAALRESLEYAFKGVHRKDNPASTRAMSIEPSKVDLEEARNLF